MPHWQQLPQISGQNRFPKKKTEPTFDTNKLCVWGPVKEGHRLNAQRAPSHISGGGENRPWNRETKKKNKNCCEKRENGHHRARVNKKRVHDSGRNNGKSPCRPRVKVGEEGRGRAVALEQILEIGQAYLERAGGWVKNWEEMWKDHGHKLLLGFVQQGHPAAAASVRS